MAIYSERDVELTFSGDLQLSANGDIKLGDSFETQKSAINWFLRTNKGENQPDVRLGCDVGLSIGKNMTNGNLNLLEDSVLQNLVRFVIARTDVRVDAVPLDCEEVGLFVNVGGKYLDDDGNVIEGAQEVLKYLFPYLEGEFTPIL